MKSTPSDNLIAMHKLSRKNGIKESHLMILLCLEEKGPSLVGVVQRAIGISQTHMSRMIRKLEASGFITRAIDPEDYRSIILRNTAKGSALAGEMVR